MVQFKARTLYLGGYLHVSWTLCNAISHDSPATDSEMAEPCLDDGGTAAVVSVSISEAYVSVYQLHQPKESAAKGRPATEYESRPAVNSFLALPYFVHGWYSPEHLHRSPH